MSEINLIKKFKVGQKIWWNWAGRLHEVEIIKVTKRQVKISQKTLMSSYDQTLDVRKAIDELFVYPVYYYAKQVRIAQGRVNAAELCLSKAKEDLEKYGDPDDAKKV